MKDGFGSPYVKVFTSNGEVTDKVTSFVYRYSQEKDDSCQLTIEADGDDVTLPDKPEFQEGAILKITWGYIADQKSKTREVVIRNIKPTFAEAKISLELLCTDKASRLKSTSSKKVHKGSVLDAAKAVTKDTGIQVLDTPPVSIPTNEQNFAFRMHDSFPQANKSDFNIIKEMAANDPNGPFEVYGRDSNLYIHKKNVNQKPIKSYTYGKNGDGLLLSFTPETKNLSRQAGSSQVNVNGWDPYNKQAFDINANDVTNNFTKLGGIIDVPPSLGSNGLGNLDGIAYVLQLVPSGDGGNKIKAIKLPNEDNSTVTPNAGNNSNTLGGQTEVKDGKDPVNADPPVKFKKRDADKFGDNLALQNPYGIIQFSMLTKDTPVVKDGQSIDLPTPQPSIGTNEQDYTFRMNDSYPINFQQTHLSSEDNVEDAYAKGANKQAQNSLDKNPAEAQVVGDCELESGKVVTFLNVSEKYSGNYYIEECEHEITADKAYLVTIRSRKNGFGGNVPSTKVKAKAEKFNSAKAIQKKVTVNKEVGPSDTTEQNKEIGEHDASTVKLKT